MREIKFRAWDNVADQMYYVGEEELIVFIMKDSGIQADQVIQDNEYIDGYYVETLHHLQYMQYTGLKDKNGREIYEGDIVLREITVFGTSANEDFIGEVKYYECRWWIDNGNDAIPLWNEADELTILGNIHENPELLERA